MHSNIYIASIAAHLFKNSNERNYQNPPPSPAWNHYWDTTKKPSNNKSIRSITLIRHGQYYSHAVSKKDKTLTKLGKIQAEITGQKLKSMGINYDNIYCSTLIRAKQTANIISRELYGYHTANLNKRIKYDYHLNEGIPSKFTPISDKMNKSGHFDNLHQDSTRINKAFKRYIHRSYSQKDENILIIGHGVYSFNIVCLLI